MASNTNLKALEGRLLLDKRRERGRLLDHVKYAFLLKLSRVINVTEDFSGFSLTQRNFSVFE